MIKSIQWSSNKLRVSVLNSKHSEALCHTHARLYFLVHLNIMLLSVSLTDAQQMTKTTACSLQNTSMKNNFLVTILVLPPLDSPICQGRHSYGFKKLSSIIVQHYMFSLHSKVRLLFQLIKVHPLIVV